MDKFKGYYFKCTNKNHTVALIPAAHGNKASLQIITDKASRSIKLSRIAFGSKPPQVKTNLGIFTRQGIKLNIDTHDLKAQGTLRFGTFTPLKYDIMGPFKLMSPILQCRHRIISMLHTVNGKIVINNEAFSFENGKGYIEGDEGTSFPKSYLWAQSFFKDGSLMLSVADVPISAASITGIIGAVMLKGREYRFGTYLGAKLQELTETSAKIKQGKYTLTLKKLPDAAANPLYAPQNGKMTRTITEYAQCSLRLRLEKNATPLIDETTPYASFESSTF